MEGTEWPWFDVTMVRNGRYRMAMVRCDYGTKWKVPNGHGSMLLWYEMEGTEWPWFDVTMVRNGRYRMAMVRCDYGTQWKVPNGHGSM